MFRFLLTILWNRSTYISHETSSLDHSVEMFSNDLAGHDTEGCHSLCARDSVVWMKSVEETTRIHLYYRLVGGGGHSCLLNTVDDTDQKPISTRF